MAGRLGAQPHRTLSQGPSTPTWQGCRGIRVLYGLVKGLGDQQGVRGYQGHWGPAGGEGASGGVG